MVIVSERGLIAEIRAGVRLDLEKLSAEERALMARLAEITSERARFEQVLEGFRTR
jgi:hypothetical protein